MSPDQLVLNANDSGRQYAKSQNVQQLELGSVRGESPSRLLHNTPISTLSQPRAPVRNDGENRKVTNSPSPVRPGNRHPSLSLYSTSSGSLSNKSPDTNHVLLSQQQQILAELSSNEIEKLAKLLYQHFKNRKIQKNAHGSAPHSQPQHNPMPEDYDEEDPKTWPSNWQSQAPAMILNPDRYLSSKPSLNSYQRELIYRISDKYQPLVQHYKRTMLILSGHNNEASTHKTTTTGSNETSWLHSSHSLPSDRHNMATIQETRNDFTEKTKSSSDPITYIPPTDLESYKTFNRFPSCPSASFPSPPPTPPSATGSNSFNLASAHHFNKWSSKMKVYLWKQSS